MRAKSSEARPCVAIGGILHETHSFVATPTTLADFQAQGLYEGEELLTALSGTRSSIGGMIAGASAYGWRLLPTIYGAAMPGGVVSELAYQHLLQELIKRLSASPAVDGVLLALHGAMVTEAYLDPESHILARIREVVGAETPIVVELDMHGNIGPATPALADICVAYDTNPHTDVYEKGIEASALLARLLDKKTRPVTAHIQLPLLLAPQATGTRDQPLRLVHERASLMKETDAVLSICVMAGFAYADTPHTGASIIVTTENRPELARHYAAELAGLLMDHREAALPSLLAPHDAVARAAASAARPVILVDSADNVGGGTPGDGTDALKAMLHLDIQEGAVVIADREAVAACVSAGEGAAVTLRVGAKSDNWHGEPVEISGIVQRISDGAFTCELPNNPFASFYGKRIHMGTTAWVRAGGVNIVLTERKTPPFDLAQLRSVGITPEAQQMIVVKSAVAYRAAYEPIAAGIIEMDTAGLCSANLARFPYRHLSRPIFPLDPLPHGWEAAAFNHEPD